MAVLRELDKPVNDGEKQVLKLLRDGLDDAWYVVSNFWVEQGKRKFECDALVVSPQGWAYLVETKAWLGRIRGNNSQWELPSLTAAGVSTYRPNPVNQTHRNSQILKDVLRGEDAILSKLFIEPLVVIVSKEQPELEGSSAEKVVLVDELLARVQEDPRDTKPKNELSGVPARVAEVLERAASSIAPPTVLGDWTLEELVETDDGSELWRARASLGGAHSPDVRLKRYRLDPLATGTEAEEQRKRARRSLDALERLGDAEGALPLLGAPFEDEQAHFVLVTAWPEGESLGSLIDGDELDASAATEVFEALVRSVASIHRANIVHRNINPDCLHFLDDGRVVLTDFDYARLPESGRSTKTVIQSGFDPLFAAPEVVVDPGTATPASDVWSVARVGLRLFGLGLDAMADSQPRLDGVPEHWRGAFEQALVIDAGSRTQDAELLLQGLSAQPQVDPLFQGFESYDVINNRYVVMPEPIGEGGLARVYRVNDVLHKTDYAAKFLRPMAEGKVDPSAEFHLLQHLPTHPGIAQPVFLQEAKSVRRGETESECSGIFVLSPWIEGTRLDRLFESDRMPAARAVEVALAVAESLVHLQQHNIMHRDVKPQNIIVDRAGVPRLVDFNVGNILGAAGKTQVGTPGYKPPDLGVVGWGTDSDPYSLCVTLAEMVSGGNVGPSVADWLKDARIPRALADVITRGTAVAKADRFQDADELAAALRIALETLQTPPVFVSDAPFPVLKQASPNTNPYMRQLMTLFSQSSETNRGTRGLDNFDRWAYVPTRVDRELYGDIARGRYRLVVITGNAGDGKTAFVQMLQQRLESDGAAVEPYASGNGALINHDGRRVVTNLDGSQDEGERSNDDVLREFFEPFAGIAPAPDQAETRVIAINEGRLIDFVSAQVDQFPALETAVMGFVSETELQLPPWLLLVNLNLRALTTSRADGGSNHEDGPDSSITHEILKRFADSRIWEPCNGCVAFNDCYARSNAALLRDPVLGPRIAERIRQTLDLVRLRRRLHVTMRDLRSALAYVVAGNRWCDEIVQLATDTQNLRNARALVAGHAYNSLFAASDKLAASFRDEAASRDRLLRLTGSVDVAKTANPDDDGRLWRFEENPFRSDPEGLERTDITLIHTLRGAIPADPRALAGVRPEIAFFHATLRRKLYLEREEPEWVQMLPYAKLHLFQRQLERTTEEDKRALVRAISASEGLFSDTFEDQLAVRLVTEVAGSERSFVPHPARDFELIPLDRSYAATYVEYEPDSIRLIHRQHDDLFLDLDLDLFETLMRILDGYTPSREELRGAWLNLRLFKERLASLPADSLVLTNDDRSFHRVARSGPATITVEEVA
jgi:serine/threonine protein kinase